MRNLIHNLASLFAQLGLPDNPAGIDSFVDAHTFLPDDLALADAPFWSPGQAAFLREETLGDANWAEVVDQLNLLLRR